MKRILVAGFHQETNTFNPIPTGMDFFLDYAQTGEEMAVLKDTSLTIGGIIKVLSEQDDVEMIYSRNYFSQSGGCVEHAVFEEILGGVLADIQAAGQLDGVFLMLHGATVTTEEPDGCGRFVERVREVVGKDVTIAVGVDLHGNITERMFRNADVISGYLQYPHLDTFETGERAARFGLMHMDKPLAKAGARVPVFFGASVYTTQSGPVGELMTRAKELAPEYGVVEYSVFQCQPWIDVPDAGASIIAYGYDEAKLKEFVAILTELELDLAGKVCTDRGGMDPALEGARKSEFGKPCILCNAADSTGAGAPGDNAASLAYVLEHAPDITFAFMLEDAPAARRAHEVGVGNTATFRLGGTKDTKSVCVEAEARVVGLREGGVRYVARQLFAAVGNTGLSAVLQIGNAQVLVFEKMPSASDPQVYRINGIEPMFCQLVDVKACTSFRATYAPFCGEIFEPDTPGAATSNLRSLPYKNIMRPSFPFDPIEEAAEHCKTM